MEKICGGGTVACIGIAKAISQVKFLLCAWIDSFALRLEFNVPGSGLPKVEPAKPAIQIVLISLAHLLQGRHDMTMISGLNVPRSRSVLDSCTRILKKKI